MRNFRKLKVWQNAMELVTDIYQVSCFLPKEETYGIKAQVSRAVISIPSNIAEGSSKNTDKEYKRFLEIALGSAFELETQLLVIQHLKLTPEKKIDIILKKLCTIQKMLNSFIYKLKNN